jgi:ankyrin repeat protein
VLDFIALLWAFVTLVWACLLVIVAWIDKSRLSRTAATLIAILVACGGLQAVPHEDWQLLMARAYGANRVPQGWVVSAAANGEIGLLSYLVDHGVDVNTRAQYGESLLGVAASAGQVAAARVLIARGARLNTRTDLTLETPLVEGAQMNHTEMVELLLDHGANPHSMDVFDRTALDWAYQNGNDRMANLLMARTGGID